MSKPVLSTGFTLTGLTSVRWGTDGYLVTPAPGGSYAGTGYYIVESMEESEKAEQAYGENGTGIEVWRAQFVHGRRWNLTVQDDTAMSAPTVNSTVLICDVATDGGTTAYTAVVISNDYRAARKQPGHRVIQVENLTLVDSQTTTAV